MTEPRPAGVQLNIPLYIWPSDPELYESTARSRRGDTNTADHLTQLEHFRMA